MGRAPCCDKANVKRGPWSPDEDDTLRNYLKKHGTDSNWIALPRKAGLKRCGKSCRLRWLNYLRPDIKHGGFTEEEDNIICSLHNNIGSRWSIIAAQLPGRTDNDVKNHWNTKLKKRVLLSWKTRLDQTSTNGSTCSVPGADGTATSSSYQQNHDYSGLVLDQVDQFLLPGLKDYSTTTSTATAVSNNCSLSSSSQDASDFFVSPFFSLEDYSTVWSDNGGAEDQRIYWNNLILNALTLCSLPLIRCNENQWVVIINPNVRSHPN